MDEDWLVNFWCRGSRVSIPCRWKKRMICGIKSFVITTAPQ